VPSKDKRRAPARCALALALSLAFALPAADAAGLGRLTVQSALGQPLRAEVEVTSVARDEAATLAVRLASQSAFRQANLEFNPALAQLRFDLDKRADGNFVVRISSLNPVNEPYLDVLLELTWATGRVLREYTVLLDPPALRAQPDVLPPVAAAAPAPAAPAAAPAPAPSPAVPVAPAPVAGTPAPAPATPAAAAPAPSRAAAAAPSIDSYTVKSGDTLGAIAARTKPSSASLDQMLVALFQANPNAFVGNNMNRLLAGRTLTIPSQADVEAISTADARSEVVAQSADFAKYRSRLAQAAAAAPAPVAAAPAPAAAGGGRVTAKVEDKAAPTTGGDQLKIAKVEPSAAPAASAAAKKAAEDEAVAKQRALKEQEERAAELKRTNEALKKALELQSKSGAAAQKQAEAKAPTPAAAAPAPAPAPAPEPAPAPAAAPTPAPAPQAAAPAPAPAPVEAPKAEAPKAEPPKAEAPKAEAPKPAPAAAPAPAASESSLSDTLTSPYVLGGIGAALLALLVGLNLYRKRKVEKSDEFKATGEGMHANSLFGATGGQSVDTGATSTFNSSFIPAASQLDSNEVDPVAEADVYIAYGREEQAEDILKEALRLQPDRHAVRVKLLEIYSRRNDKASFMAVAQELRERTGGVGEDWERGAKLGRALDPNEPMFAGAAGAGDLTRGPTTELRLNPATAGGRPATLGGLGAAVGAAAGAVAAQPARAEEPDLSFTASLNPPTRGGPDTRMTPDTAMPLDSRLGTDTRQGAAPSTTTGPTTRFEATLSSPTVPAEPAKADILAPATSSAVDFSALDFDLGGPATRMPEGPKTAMPTPTAFDLSFDAKPAPVEPPKAEAALARPTAAPTVGGFGSIPDVDLSLPAKAPVPPAPSLMDQAPTARVGVQSALEESLARPTLLGDVGALPDERAPRLTSNTDQATVPLIDFDLTGSDVELGGRRTETQAGSPLAAQMATKLDLARGYIDLGVKDGARELLEEVMRDGTREQRQSAVELMKQVES
jgi:pilus assembly protein FimV